MGASPGNTQYGDLYVWVTNNSKVNEQRRKNPCSPIDGPKKTSLNNFLLQAKRDIADAAGARFAARSPRQHSALVLLHRAAGPEDVLQAFCFGLLLADPELLQSRQVTGVSRNFQGTIR